MKTIIIAIGAVVLLGSCSSMEPAQRPVEVVDKRLTGRYIDICDREAMPRFPNRPRLSSDELRGLTTKQIDAKIQEFMKKMDQHVDRLESVIVRTRDRVQECR